MSLFTKSDTPTLNLHGSDFIRFHSTACDISVESASVFLGKTKDIMSSFGKLFDLNDDQKPFTQAGKNKHEVIALVKEVKMVDFRHHVISKPEMFKGLYIDYAEDLYASGVNTASLVVETTDKLKLLVSTFINEYKDSQVNDIYGYEDFKSALTKLDKLKSKMKVYFTAPVNKVKTTPDEVLKSLSDIEKLYSKLELLGSVFSHSSLTKTNRDVYDLSDMIDNLITHNVQSKVLTKNNDSKRQLMECINITAQCVEFYSALYAQALIFSTSFKSLTDELKELA